MSGTEPRGHPRVARNRLALVPLLFAGTATNAAPLLDPVFTSNGVIQRGAPVRIAGTDAAGERVRVSLGSQLRSATADAAGRWSVEFDALPAGGPHRIEARSATGAALADNLLVGDIWLCAGQSNMELAVSRALNADGELAEANDAQLRLLKVPQKTAAQPASRFGKQAGWAVAGATSVGAFSAACYFMGRELRRSEQVPIGLIDASWGGTAIRSWMDAEAARTLGGPDLALFDLHRRDPAAAERAFGKRWEQWWAGQQPARPWADPSTLAWKPMKVGYWEQWGEPEFERFNGMVWAKTVATLTVAEARQAATLSLGVIDELDQVWVNGVPAGNTFGWDVERNYALPPGALRAGDNVIVVNIIDSYGAGGFQGPAERIALRLADGTVKPLAPRLEYAVAPARSSDPPRPPWDAAAGISLIYNGMIAPLGPIRLKGIAWYQGEADAGMAAGYAGRLSAMMNGWRRQFRDPELPFLIVGLPGWGGPHVAPTASGWTEVRDAQRRIGTTDPHAALVPAIDIGDRLELHPPQKQAVGQRLARAARALAYRQSYAASGPQFASAVRNGRDVVVRFAGVSGQLRAWSGPPVGFELCADTQASCRFAGARVQGSTVHVFGDGRPATRVRYAWADAPVVNLFDEVPLPVSSFEAPIP